MALAHRATTTLAIRSTSKAGLATWWPPSKWRCSTPCVVKHGWFVSTGAPGWVAPHEHRPGLPVAHVIEYAAAHWKTRSRIPSDQAGDRQCPNADAHPRCSHQLSKRPHGSHHHHLELRSRLGETPARRHAAGRLTEYAFADVRRALARDLADVGFGVACGNPDHGSRNPLIAAVTGLVA
jgi:hypothetical protein